MNPTQAKLKRNPDGSYSGTHKSHEFTVRKEQLEERITPTVTRTETVWVARSGSFEGRSVGNHATRDEAVKRLRREIDKAAVHVPEVDALLKRWAGEVKAIVPLLDENDHGARSRLELLSSQLTMFDSIIRGQAVSIERDINRLKAHVQRVPGSPALQQP